jgi:hypothetical protein
MRLSAILTGEKQTESAPAAANQPPKEDLSKVAARTNLNETAFFYPLLSTNENGEIIVKFQIPEALTKWKMLGFAHTKDLKYGQISKELVTQKDLMVMPNLPRFFRENDNITLTAKVSNMADKDLSGTAQLMLFDAATAKPVDAEFRNNAAQVSFTAKKGQSAPLAWDLAIPEGMGAVSVRIVAKSGNFSDGEEQIVPVLSNRMLVTETMPLPIRKKGTKILYFQQTRVAEQPFNHAAQPQAHARVHLEPGMVRHPGVALLDGISLRMRGTDLCPVLRQQHRLLHCQLFPAHQAGVRYLEDATARGAALEPRKKPGAEIARAGRDPVAA